MTEDADTNAIAVRKTGSEMEPDGDMDAAARLDRLGAMLDEDDRRRRANRGVYRLRQEPRGLHVLAAAALLPRGGFDHRALNAAPKSQRRR